MVKASLSRLTGTPAVPALDPAATITDFPGAALLVGPDGHVIDANVRSQPLQSELERLSNLGKREGLAAVIRDASLSGAPLTARILVARADGEDAGQQAFDVTLLPLISEADDASSILVLGVEATLQRNLTRALKTSRDLFRDLVLCSSDFAWETDRRGVFVYVGPRGAAGFAAEALHGRSAFSLLPLERDGGENAIQRVFLANEPQEDQEVWLSGADGQSRCFLVSAVPVYDAGDLWCGARGVGRDVTEQRLQEKVLSDNKARSDLIRNIVDTIRKEMDPIRMLQVTSETIGTACDATSCWVLDTDDGMHYEPLAEYHTGRKVALPQQIRTAIGGQAKSVSYTLDGFVFDARRTSLYGQPNGAICTARADEVAEGAGAAAPLLDEISDHAAVVLAQAKNLIQLTQLSRTDSLTGLLNRRAFEEELTIRLARHCRYGRVASMLYLDVDNFKQINDGLGHARGDELLCQLSRILTNTARNTDLLVRFGGDEFGLFLDETDEQDARKVIDRILAGADLMAWGHAEEPTLSVSIGLAVWMPQSVESQSDLVARADAALYDAKKNGKGRFAIAPPWTTTNERETSLHVNGV